MLLETEMIHYEHDKLILWKFGDLKMATVITARVTKYGARLYFHKAKLCFCRYEGGQNMVAGEGACVVARWGMRGCTWGACVVARGSCVVAAKCQCMVAIEPLLWGACNCWGKGGFGIRRDTK